jgi:hypothetical protein
MYILFLPSITGLQTNLIKLNQYHSTLLCLISHELNLISIVLTNNCCISFIQLPIFLSVWLTRYFLSIKMFLLLECAYIGRTNNLIKLNQYHSTLLVSNYRMEAIVIIIIHTFKSGWKMKYFVRFVEYFRYWF